MNDKIIEAIDSVIKTQKADGNWNYDPYMHGMLNGMLLIETIVTDKKYNPYSAPKRWKSRNWYERIIDKILMRNKVVKQKVE